MTDPVAPAPGQVARVTVVGRAACHLCHDAEAIVAQVCAELGVAWDTASIDDDDALHAQYWEQIPVILVDGRQHDFYRVDPARLRRALQG